MASETSFTGSIEAKPYPFRNPKNWMPCDGRTLKVSEYGVLFDVIKNRFGGDGTTTFKLPDLTSRVVVGAGKGPGLTPRTQGDCGGTTWATITPDKLPAHTHSVQCSREIANEETPENHFPAQIKNTAFGNYAMAESLSIMGPEVVKPTGEGLAHDNLQPVLVLPFMICVNGEDPYTADH